jgi:ribose/xylose/arabinose/galactoside ABC-type transport system permease subunit
MDTTLSRGSSRVISGGAVKELPTIILLFIVGIASLIVAEQVLTGWLALGERANILRSNKNIIEIVVIAGTAIWGLLALWTAGSLLRGNGNSNGTVRRYFEHSSSPMPPGVILSIAALTIVGVISLLIAEQVITGWLALGARVNISRRDINTIEWAVIIGATLWGLITLRTAWGFVQRVRASWTYAQWVLLVTAVIGLGLLLSGTFDIQNTLAGKPILENLPLIQELTAPGLLIFFSCLAVYRFLSVELDLTADQVIRNNLAKSPGAGAIIGFFVILALFSLSTDLFLEQRSVAGILATNITRGIVAIGITFLMISGEFDLSVGSVFGAGALVYLLMMTEGIPPGVLLAVPLVVIGLTFLRTPRLSLVGIGMIVAGFVGSVFLAGQPPVITTVIPALLIALAFAGLLGYVNGTILIATGIPSFIVTLGTLLAYRAILLVVVADGRILRYADYRLPPPNVYLSRWIIVVGAIILGLAVLFMGRSLIPSMWKNFQMRLSKRSEGGDFADLSAFLSFAYFLLITAAIIAVVVFLGAIVLNQIQLVGETPIIEVSFFDLANGKFDFVPSDVNLRSGVLWWLLLVIGFQFVLTQTPYGNHVFAVGGNPGAARAQGINVNGVKVTNFIICSVLAALAGIISVARLANVDPLMGQGLELEVIAASVIGGALLSGGYGSIIGALLGVLIFGMLQTGLVLIGVDSKAFSGIIGIIIIVAVVVNTAVGRARK